MCVSAYGCVRRREARERERESTMIVYILHSQLICACVACANIINALDQFSIYIEIGDCGYTADVVADAAPSNTAFTMAGPRIAWYMRVMYEWLSVCVRECVHERNGV